MFSSHIDMIYKNSALQDIAVKLLFIEYRLSKKIPLIWESDDSSEYISTNSGIHPNFGSITGGKVSQLWVSYCSAQIQWVACGKKSAFWSLLLVLTFFIKSR